MTGENRTRILTDQNLQELVKEPSLDHQVDGIIATNTTLNHKCWGRPILAEANEAGGLSGRPLLQQSTQVIHRLHRLLAGQLPIIGVGGIFSAEDALEKLTAGASLVQIYTGLIYQGPGLIRQIITDLNNI